MEKKNLSAEHPVQSTGIHVLHQVDVTDGDENLQETHPDLWGKWLPEEILLYIIQLARTTSDAPIVLLCRLAQVCSRWSTICGDESLWETVDFSCGWIRRDVEGMKALCGARLAVARKLNISVWYNLTDQHLHDVAAHFANLSALTISHCNRLTTASLECLADHEHCPSITSLSLTYLPPVTTMEETLSNVVLKLGSQLLKLDLSGNHLGCHFSTVLSHISATCGKLEELVIQDNQDWNAELFDLNKLRHGCPHLRQLHLTGSKFYYPPTLLPQGCPGFLNLEGFSGPAGMTTHFLQCGSTAL